jgi:hypothetical protein
VKWFLLILSLALPSIGSAASSSLEEVAASPGWLRLLHYKKHWFTGYTSSVDGTGFFLHPEGARDPEAELRETLKALEAGGGAFGKLQQPIGCAFPLRKEFLEKALGRKFPSDPCPDFEDYVRKLDPTGATLVFATAYPSNPASMFGHSFLKITSGKNREQGISMLDWSINYAAMVPADENSFAFAAFGLAGGYQGQFSLVPYYSKIEEYGFSEGRDMWEYELNLSPAEVLTLLKAVWEVETNSYFLYFFFDENCSYQILTMLEIVKPEWDISGYFMHMIPGESVQRVAGAPGAVRSVRMRPSLERRLRAVAAEMDGADWRKYREASEKGPAVLSGRSLQAYLLFLQAEKKRKESDWTTEDEAKFREALLVRAKRSAEAPEETSQFGGERTRPDLAHGSDRIGLGPVMEKKGDWKGGVELAIRFAYHDLLDADPGFTPHSEVMFPNFRFRYSERTKSFRLHEAELLSLVSLVPKSLMRWPWSWRARIAFQPMLDLSCEACRGLHAESGFGKAISLKNERWTVWGMLGAEGDWAEALDSTVRAAPWLEFGSLLTLPSEGKILLESRLGRGFGRGGPWRLDLHGAISQPLGASWALHLEGRAASVLEISSRLRLDTRLLAVRYF